MPIKVLDPEVVAQIAAGKVVERPAEEDWGRRGKRKGARRPRRELPAEQLALFAATPALLEELEKLDISSMTPLEALNKLYELQQKAKEG